MTKISILIFIIITAVSPLAKSQEIENIVTDRPDVTESSLTVPKRSFQLETGFVYSKNKYKSDLGSVPVTNLMQTDEYLNTPTMLARFGLTNEIELRLGAQITTYKFSSSDPETESLTNTDIDGVQIAVKLKLSKQKKVLPSIAVIVGSVLPAVSTIYSSDAFDPTAVFCFSNVITEKFGAGYNLGINLDDGFNSTASGDYSFSLSYSLTDFLGMFGEAYGNIPFSNIRALNYLDGGFTLLIRENFQLDFSGGYGLNSGITEYFFNTGVSIRLPN